jgi:predicted nucleotidyltransferase
VVALDKLNAQKAISALESLGLIPRVPVDAQEFSEADQRARWIEEKGMTVFTMIHPANPFVNVDLFVDPPIPYERLILRAERLDIEDLTVTVCGIDDIIAMKRLAGRSQDVIDIEALSRIRDERSRN